MNGTSYDYRMVPARVMEAFAEPTEEMPDAFLAEDFATAAVRGLLAQGFRWVRTENGMAVLERQMGPKVVGTLDLAPRAVNPHELASRVHNIIQDALFSTSYEAEIESLVRRLIELGH